MTISCYIKSGIIGTWHDLSDKVDTSSKPNITKRIDDAFASGNVKVWWNRSTPIPPYSPFLVDGRFMVGTSRVTKYLPETNLYVHDIRLLEFTAFLKCFIVGTKVYSAESATWGLDYSKIISLINLATNVWFSEYTFNIAPEQNIVAYLAPKITTQKTYLYGAKDTLYDCLNKICMENNQKLRAEFDELDPTVINIYLDAVPETTGYTLDSSRIIYDSQDQNEEDYCRYLETYASNVVDRNTITKAEWLFPTSDDVALSADNAIIKLPTVAEQVKEFGIHQAHEITLYIGNLEAYFSDCDTRFANSMSYSDLSMNYTMIGEQGVYIFDEIYDNYIAKYFPYVTRAYFYSTAYSLAYTIENLLPIVIPISCNGKYPLRTWAEKSVWSLRTPQDQSGCAFYTTGSDKIENLNSYYKNDLWNNILHITTYNFLTYSDESPHTTFMELDLYMTCNLSVNTNPLQYMYWCDYTAITNPLLRDDKDTNATIESGIAPISRSYGNSDNFIDFDKLIPNMRISNKTLGTIERTIQLDLTPDANSIVPIYEPSAGQFLTLDSQTWYISNVIFEYGADMKTATLTLVKDYNKKAACIGVDSQSESTNNPLKNITTRPIMINSEVSTPTASLAQRTWYMRFRFKDKSGAIIANPDGQGGSVTWLIKRCSVQATEEAILFYCEMTDQVVFDYGRTTFDTYSWYEQEAFKYCDDNAECAYVEVQLGTMAATTAYPFLPILFPQGTNSTFTPVYTFNQFRIDKDARERLTFSIRLNKVDYR